MPNWFVRKEQIEEILSEEEKLRRSIDKLNNNLRRQISWRHTFLRAIVTGVGTFLGATIVAGILLGLLSQILDTSKQIDAFKIIIEKTSIDEVVNNGND